jgi:hypothetical protein
VATVSHRFRSVPQIFCAHPQFAVSPFLSLVARDNHLVSQAELDAAQTGILDPITQMPFGSSPCSFRGEVQTNTVARLGESKFAGIGDFHSSIGAEMRFQCLFSTCLSPDLCL